MGGQVLDTIDLEYGRLILTHSLKEELEELKVSFVFSVSPEQMIP